MFQRAGFLGPVKLAAPSHRSPAFSRRLGGMLEDYNNEINALKEKLSTLQKPYIQPAPPPSQFPAAPAEPSTYYGPTPPYQPPSGQPNCYTRPDGSAYWGYADGISTPNNLGEFQCMGAAQARPLEPEPPPSITSEVDLPPMMPPISLEADDEVPPPVPTPPPSPGVHPPISTGIPYGEEAQPPLRYWPPPTEEELGECPRGAVWAAPGDICPRGMSRTVPGSQCCYPGVASVDPYYPSGDVTVAPSFPGLPFGGEGGAIAPSLRGRRTYPVVNLGNSRRML